MLWDVEFSSDAPNQYSNSQLLRCPTSNLWHACKLTDFAGCSSGAFSSPDFLFLSFNQISIVLCVAVVTVLQIRRRQGIRYLIADPLKLNSVQSPRNNKN